MGSLYSFASFCTRASQLRRGRRRIHVAAQVRDLRDHLLRQLDLGPQLLLDLLDLPPALQEPGLRREVRPLARHRVEIPLRIDEARRLRQRTPLVVLPLAGEGQVHADVVAGVLAEHLGRLVEPRARHHAPRRSCTIPSW